MALGQECLVNIWCPFMLNERLSPKLHLLTQSDSLQPAEGETTEVEVPPQRC